MTRQINPMYEIRKEDRAKSSLHEIVPLSFWPYKPFILLPCPLHMVFGYLNFLFSFSTNSHHAVNHLGTSIPQ